MIDLKSLVILTILSASFGIASSDFMTEMYGRWKGKQLPKPFGCSFCMAFWGGFIYSLVTYSLIDSIFIGCLSAITSSFITKYLNT